MSRLPDGCGVSVLYGRSGGECHWLFCLPGSGEFAAGMNDVHHLNAGCRDPVENDIVWMRHDFTHARYALARLEKIGMLCRMLKIVLYPIKKTFCGLLVVLTDGVQNFQ